MSSDAPPSWLKPSALAPTRTREKKQEAYPSHDPNARLTIPLRMPWMLMTRRAGAVFLLPHLAGSILVSYRRLYPSNP